MIHAWKDVFRRLFQRIAVARPPTPELTTLENPEKYSLASPNLRQGGSKFLESFEAPQSPNGSTIHQSHNTLLLPPLPSSPPMPPPLPTPPSKLFQRPCQSLLLHTSSISSCQIPSTLPRSPSTTHTPNQTSPEIHTTSPTPTSCDYLPLPRPQPHCHSSTSYETSRPPPLPNQQKALSSSYMGSRTQSSERSWRDSTISVLDKIVSNGEERDARFTKGSKLHGMRISGPVSGSFVHVDGAFVDRNVQHSVFRDA
jgi:hypothetical protein